MARAGSLGWLAPGGGGLTPAVPELVFAGGAQFRKGGEEGSKAHKWHRGSQFSAEMGVWQGCPPPSAGKVGAGCRLKLEENVWALFLAGFGRAVPFFLPKLALP